MRAELIVEMREAAALYKAGGRSQAALGLKQGPLQASIAELEKRYGAQLDANSHGESFLKLFQSRFVPGGLYLLDEPEAPLSPQSQLALLAMIGDMISHDAQFIIATHSPLLLAFPDAQIHRVRVVACAEAAVRILRQAARRHIGHTIVAHAAGTDIDRDRSATGAKTEQQAAARGPHPRGVAVEVVARRAAAAAVARVAPEQRPAHGRKSVDAERATAQRQLGSRADRADL